MRKRFVKEWGPIKYIQSWEVHKSGRPHVNVVISNQALHYAACNTPWCLKTEWLEPTLLEVGFGSICHMKPVYNREGMAGYLLKFLKELTGASKKGQIPVNAPKGFRRLRASKGLLPKRKKDPDWTGRLVKSPLPETPASGVIVNGVDPGWLQERLLLEEMECLQQAPLPYS